MINAEIVTRMDEETIPEPIWNSLLVGGGTSSPFQNRDWLSVWMRTIGAHLEPFFIKLTDNEKIVGFIPLAIVSSSIGPISIRTLQFVGQPEADYSEFLIAGDRSTCFKAMLSCILDQANRWDVAIFDHLAEDSPSLGYFKESLAALGIAHQIQLYDVLPYAEIGDSFDQYWSLRTRNMRYDIGKKGRRLEQRGKVAFQRYHGADALQRLAVFFEVIKSRDIYKNRLSASTSYEKDQVFLSELLRTPALEPYVHFSCLNVDDVAIAYHFGFVDQKALYYYKAGYSPAYAEYSPGRLLIRYLFMDCAQANIPTVDFLLGSEPYKYSWSTAERRCFTFRVYHKGWKSQLARLWLAGVRPRLKQSRLLVKLVKSIRGFIRMIRSREGKQSE